jgi:hypothetical protein
MLRVRMSLPHFSVGDKVAKVSGRKRERVATQIGKPRLVLRIGEASVDLLIELVDDPGRITFSAFVMKDLSAICSRVVSSGLHGVLLK